MLGCEDVKTCRAYNGRSESGGLPSSGGYHLGMPYEPYHPHRNSYPYVLQLIPIIAEDPRCRPFVQITGTAINANKDTSTFEVDSAQYTAALKNDRPFSVFPVRGLIPYSHRYKKGKPVPHNNTYVSFSGFLCRFTIDETGFPDRFYVDVENISFLGRPTVPAPIPVISPDDSK